MNQGGGFSDLKTLYDERAKKQLSCRHLKDEDNKKKTRVIIEWATEKSGLAPSILDVGCGSGDIAAEVAKKLPYSEVVGVDVSEVWIQEAERRHGDIPNLKFMVADARDLPFDDNEFDMVICAEVLEHLPGDGWKKALKEVERVTSDKAIITIPDDKEPDGIYHVHRLTPGKILRSTKMRLDIKRTIKVKLNTIDKVWVLLLEKR